MSSVGPATNFPSILAFQNYFKEHETLEVPANQALLIRDIRILRVEEDPNRADERVDPFNYDRFQWTLHLINRILHPLGKTCKVIPSQPGSLGSRHRRPTHHVFGFGHLPCRKRNYLYALDRSI
jgi:hypothetical protein